MAKSKKIILHEGGSRSSKTYSILEFFILKAMEGEVFNITIARRVFKDTKSTILKDFEDLCETYKIPIYPQINYNRPEQRYQIKKGVFEFFGLDNAGKIHGKKQDYVWLNEVMEIDKKSFDQLEMRTTRQMILDFNPWDDTHWVFELEKRSDVGKIHSTMLDNPFLPETIINKIRSYEPTEENYRNGTADSYNWDVYGLGKKAKLQGVIFDDWDIVDSIPENADLLGYGLDFGYSVDPATLIAGYKYSNELYFDEVFYETGLNNQDICEKLEYNEIEKDSLIIGDSAEPKSIDEIYNAGFIGMQGAEKGADSIRFGINLLKKYKVHITKRSINIQNEARKYKWAEDRNGNRLKKPVDAFNHSMDAIRYLTTYSLRRFAETQLYEKNLFV